MRSAACIAIHNFGAGDIIEIAPLKGATMLLPFTNAVVPEVDIAGGRVVIELPRDRRRRAGGRSNPRLGICCPA